MADDAVIWSTLSAIAAGIVGGITGWVVKRVEKAPDIQATLSAAIANVVDHYKGALDRSDGEAAALRAEVADLRRLVEAQSIKIDEQSADIEMMVEHIGRLEASIVALGGNPPPRRKRGKPTDEVQA